MEIDAADSDDDEHHREKEEERHRSKKRDLPRQRTRLELLRHAHADVESGQQAGVAPAQTPAIAFLRFLRWRKSVFGKIDVVEVRAHHELEVAHFGNVISEHVSPAGEAARIVADSKRYGV